MNHNAKQTSFAGGWKVLIILVIFGYTISTVLAFDIPGHQSQVQTTGTPQATVSNPSFQQNIENNVALGAKKVWTNLVDFMKKGFSSEKITNQEENKNQQKTAIAVPQRNFAYTQLPQSETAILPSFSDINNDQNKESIELLASIGLIDNGKSGKYYPKNFVRVNDFLRVVVDTYRYKIGFFPQGEQGLTEKIYLPLSYPDTLLVKKLNTAQELGLLKNLENIQLEEIITPTQAKQIINNLSNLKPEIIQSDNTNLDYFSSTKITKSEMAGYLAHIFQLEKGITSNLFNDISNHKYHSSISKLAQLGVVAGKNGNFYPDNYALRSDGIIMITNSWLIQQGKPLIISDFTHINTINDTTYFAAFAPHLEYLLTNEVGDFLLHPQQSGYLFLPNTQLTKGEAYILVSQVAGVKLLNVDPSTRNAPITRGELADLLVQAFDFSKYYTESNPNNTITQTTLTHKSSTQKPTKGLLLSFFKDAIDSF